MRIVVFGGAGFIGSAVCRMLVAERGSSVLNLDKLTATSSLASLRSVSGSPRYSFRRADIRDRERVTALLHAFAPDAVVHAATERNGGAAAGSTEARDDADALGMLRSLEAAQEFWATLSPDRQKRFRFVSASAAPTDAQTQTSRCSTDAMVTAWHTSYGLPTIVSRATPTFGPNQFPDAPLPAAIIAAIDGEPVVVQGAASGAWLHVDDHARALLAMLDKGTPGATYSATGRGRMTSAGMADRIRQLVERHGPKCGKGSRPAMLHRTDTTASQPQPVRTVDGDTDLERDTGWRPEETIETALSRTVRWYLANESWWRPLQAAQRATSDFGVLRIA